MNILSIDTTTKKASVTLKKDTLIISKSVDNEITHSEKLLPLIDSILKENNLKINDIDKYAVLNGPGSFTGIRISLATLKAFTMVNNKDIFSISALEAMAISAFLKELNENKFKDNNEKYILSLIDARNDRVYYELFKISIVNNKLKTESILTANNELIETLLNTLYPNIPTINKNNEIIIACNNLENFENTINNKLKLTNTKCIDIYPSTEDLIYIMENISNLDNYIFDTYSLDANYVRPSQAERMKGEIKNEKNK